MKNKWLLSILCLLLFFSGCEQLEDILGLNQEEEGTISFYGNKMDSISASTLYGPSIKSYIYLKKIEISKTGETWTTILDTLTEVNVSGGEPIRIGTSKKVKKGEYHGVKIVIEPKVKFTHVETWDGTETTTSTITLNKLPEWFELGTGGGIYTDISSSDTLILTSANGYLTPFDIEPNAETFFVFDLQPIWSGDDINSITDWLFRFSVRTTRFLY